MSGYRHTVVPEDYVHAIQNRSFRVSDAAVHALAKHGYENTPLSSLMPEAEKLAILVEEVGEVAKEMTYDHRHAEDHSERVVKELLQVAAVAVMWAASYGMVESRSD